MKKDLHIATAFIALMCMYFSADALADTDYQCLHICAGRGKPEMVCMPQCTYMPQPAGKISVPMPNDVSSGGVKNAADKIDTSAPPSLSYLKNHRILTPLQPIANNQVEIPNIQVSPYKFTTDYRCMSQCFTTKLQYQICQKACTDVTLSNGTEVVKNNMHAFDPDLVAIATSNIRKP